MTQITIEVSDFLAERLTAMFDPQTGRDGRLFNPRLQKWGIHFQLNTDGTIFRRTAAGRATARLLHFHDPWRVRMRADLISAGKLSVKRERG